MGDLKSFQERVIALRQAIANDGVSYGVPFHVKDLKTCTERYRSEGASFFKVTLPLLGKALDLGLVTGQFNCPANFAVKRNTRLPILLHGCFTTMFDDTGLLRPRSSSTVIYFTRQFLLLDAKLIEEPTPKQKSTAIQGFKDRQNLLRKKKIQADHPVILRATNLLGVVLRTLDIGTIEPGHGPGSVAEKLDREERWDFRSWPRKAERYYPYGVYGTHSLRASLERGCGIPLIKEMNTRCVLVPKDFRGPRLISAEPTVNQYLQQGQMKAIMDYIDNHEVLGRSLRMRDQTRNQRMASVSHDEGTVTLDLSDASDTVSTVLVWHLLSKVPHIRNRLMSTRSDNLTFNGEKVKIVAFAPMGSAVCFPVESLVFWALSMGSLMLVRPRASFDCRETGSLTYHEWICELSSSLGVFGDDIIVPSDALNVLLGTLDTVGCKPNMSKTCWKTPFRESCGSEWMNNTDVTIIRNRRYYYEDRTKFISHPALAGLQRKFFLRGLYGTARLLSEWTNESWPTPSVPIDRISSELYRNYATSIQWGDGILFGSQGFTVQRIRQLERNRRKSYNGPAVDTQRRYTDGNDFPSACEQAGVESFFFRESIAVDCFPFLLGSEFDIPVKLPVRWNKNYQRLESRIPREFHDSKNWKLEGYSRLFARLSSDSMERIAKRDRKIELAWSYLPGSHLLSKVRS